MKTITTVNNAELVLNEGTFLECIELHNVLLNTIKKIKIDIGELEVEDVLGLNGTKSISYILDTFKSLFLELMTSKEFDKAIYSLLKYCTYNDIKITKTLFEDVPEARQDYYQIIKECVEINLNPFMKSLISQLSILLPIEKLNNQKSEQLEEQIEL